jgi:predicted nuclease of predicted toxin-antitoxin system
MKLLLDVNPSWQLCKAPSARFTRVEHVKKIPLSDPVPDEEVWDHPKANEFCVVTNDEDFLKLLPKVGFPPKVILPRMGSQSTDFVRDALLRHTADIDYSERSEDYGLLEIYG